MLFDIDAPPLGNSIHLWSLDLSPSLLNMCAAMKRYLSDDEQARADRFYFKRESDRFVCCRAVLRMLISAYVSVDPREVHFTYNAHGKPALSDEMSQGLQFNLAHSEDVAVFAFVNQRPIGVDVERLRPVVEFDQLVKQVFSASEEIAMQTISAEQRQEAFFQGWTCKEAYIKAIGKGLSQPLDTFVVSVNPNEEAQLLSVKDFPDAPQQWMMHRFTPTAGYIAAVAVEGRDMSIICRSLNTRALNQNE